MAGFAAPCVRAFGNTAALDAALGAYICDAADSAIAARGRFVVATSGGSLPKNLGTALAAAAASGRSLRPELWHVFYADERHVPLDHADSNHAATNNALASATWWKSVHAHPVKPELPLEDCATAYEAEIISVAGGSRAEPPAFDLVLLGMGPDGHTASLFPGHGLLGEANLLIAPISDSPKPPPTRVTFTYPLINAAHRVAFVALGEGKAPVLAQVCDPAVAPEQRLPAGRVRQADGAGATWFVDTSAAAQLPAVVNVTRE